MKQKKIEAKQPSIEEISQMLDRQAVEINEMKRELEIEASLEKVRAQALGMRKPDDLLDICEILYLELYKMGFDELRNAMINIYEEGKTYFINYDFAPGSGKTVTRMPYDLHPLIDKQVKETKKTADAFSEFSFTGKDLTEFRELRKNNGELDDPKLDESSSLYYYFYSIGTGSIGISTYGAITLEKLSLLKRFRNVLNLSYQRYADIAQAEAQTRESQIQLAMERVRARTMAMQRSGELKEVAMLLFEQVKALGIEPWASGFNIWEEGNDSYIDWVSTPAGFLEPYRVDLTTHPVFRAISDAKKRGEDFYVFDTSGEALSETYALLISFAPKQFEGIIGSGIPFPERQINHYVYGEQVGLMFITPEPCPEAHDIFKRFGKVFEQTYTRFLDLQKAEAQSREAQIELGLERVRARAMAMQHSEELKDLIDTVFTELTKLDIVLTRCLLMIYDPGNKGSWWWMANSEAQHEPIGLFVQYHELPPYLAYLKAWEAKTVRWQYNLEGQIKKDWDNFLFSQTELSQLPDYVIAGMKAPDSVTLSASFNNFGNLTLATLEPLSEEHSDVLLRFAKVFDLTYTRFNDLQKAEAQARESQIEAALERVRSRTLAMQKSDELAETAAEVFRQLIALGIEPNRLYIGIIKGEGGDMEMWATDEDGTQVGKKFMFNKNENDSVRKLYNGWVTKQKSVIVNMEGKELEDYFHYLNHVMHIPFKEGLTQKRRVQSVAYFSKGFIGMASPDGQGDETILLLERFAAVFNLTFTRFNDLKIAEAHAEQAELDLILLKEEKKRTEEALNELQITQNQLIQSEKMASLGELTAGIAHEIQNPLNFVNNFSEVSTELVDEMNEEIKKGNLEDAQLIARDLKDNLTKINHHGKRAGDIVKGMLQHSRSSSGVKEPTDINALVDEYLRLAYHGLRAKDKSFNANMQTDFDGTVGMVSVTPQDIGRVVLNLITNAFYAVNEKKNQSGVPYEPTVTINTKKNTDTIEISVKDNGNGIPKKVLDKIFQPFFTTKPTGQGTGLGLSLSYDIVKAHGGELKVNSKEGDGSRFTVIIPVN